MLQGNVVLLGKRRQGGVEGRRVAWRRVASRHKPSAHLPLAGLALPCLTPSFPRKKNSAYFNRFDCLPNSLLKARKVKHNVRRALEGVECKL